MKYNLLLIANKPSAAVAMTNIEYNTREAAEAAVDTLREGLYGNSAYSVVYFITAKGEQDDA